MAGNKRKVKKDTVARAANKPEYVTGTGQKLWRVHLKQDCQHRICDIHNPPKGLPESDWPTHWRSDRGLMERICPHGIGHPTKAHMEFLKEMDAVRGTENAKWEGIHGCDGCCGVDFGKDDLRAFYPEPEFPNGASDWERGLSWNELLESLFDRPKRSNDDFLEFLFPKKTVDPEWIDRDAQPNGIGPVCKYCHNLIDWSPTDHALDCARFGPNNGMEG